MLFHSFTFHLSLSLNSPLSTPNCPLSHKFVFFPRVHTLYYTLICVSVVFAAISVFAPYSVPDPPKNVYYKRHTNGLHSTHLVLQPPRPELLRSLCGPPAVGSSGTHGNAAYLHSSGANGIPEFRKCSKMPTLPINTRFAKISASIS